MVSKCANVRCAATFHYFGTGKLVISRKSAEKSTVRGERRYARDKVEYFWFCPACAGNKTLQRELAEISSFQVKKQLDVVGFER